MWKSVQCRAVLAGFHGLPGLEHCPHLLNLAQFCHSDFCPNGSPWEVLGCPTAPALAFGLFLVICLLSHGSFLRAVGSHFWSVSGPGVEGRVSSPASWPSSLAAAGAAKNSELPGSSLLGLLSFSRVRRVKRHNRLVPSCCTCVIRMSEKRQDGEGGISKIPKCPWVSQTCNRAFLNLTNSAVPKAREQESRDPSQLLAAALHS